MKKVLFLIHTLGGGGAEKIFINTVNNIDKSKYDITVMTVVDVGIYKSHLNKNIKYKSIIKIPFINKNKKESTKNSFKNESGSLLNKTTRLKKILIKIYTFIWKYVPAKIIYKLFIKEKYDVEISFLEGICAKLISNSSNKNSKKYSWIHVDLVNQSKSSKVFKNIEEEKETYSRFDKIVCVSKIVKEQFIKKYNIDENKIVVKYNPIDEEEIINKSKEQIEKNLIKNKFLMISIGRLNAQKAYDRLLRIHKKLVSENFDYELWIIGEGTSKDELQKYIDDNNLNNSVKLLGFKSNPYKYLKIADLFVCSSFSEGFSTVVSEATILGIPVITTECSGMKEIIGNNNEYGIVTKNDEEALYKGIKELLTDVNMYMKYKNKIKERANLFNLDRAVKKIEELLEEA